MTAGCERRRRHERAAVLRHHGSGVRLTRRSPGPTSLTVRLGGSQAAERPANDSAARVRPGDPIGHGGLRGRRPAGFVTVNAGGRLAHLRLRRLHRPAARPPLHDPGRGGPSECHRRTPSSPSPVRLGYPLADGPRPSFVNGSTIGSTASLKVSWCGLISGATPQVVPSLPEHQRAVLLTKVDKTTATSSTRTVPSGRPTTSFQGPGRRHARAATRGARDRTSGSAGPRTRSYGRRLFGGLDVGRTARTPEQPSPARPPPEGVRPSPTRGVVLRDRGARGSTRGKFKVYVDGAYERR